MRLFYLLSRIRNTVTAAYIDIFLLKDAFEAVGADLTPASLAKALERDLNPERIIDELSVMKDRSINKKEDLIIFDEIQSCPNALTSLKYFQERTPEIALCAAGSLLGVRLCETSYPVGKVDHLHLYPLSFY